MVTVCTYQCYKIPCVISESKKNVQCDILPASNDGEHSGVSHFSGVYILPISPSIKQSQTVPLHVGYQYLPTQSVISTLQKVKAFVLRGKSAS